MIPILPRTTQSLDGVDGVVGVVFEFKYMWESFFLFFIRSI